MATREPYLEPRKETICLLIKLVSKSEEQGTKTVLTGHGWQRSLGAEEVHSGGSIGLDNFQTGRRQLVIVSINNVIKDESSSYYQ